MMVVTFYSMTEQEEWANALVLNGNGTIATKNQGIKSMVGQEIQYWMNEAENAKIIFRKIRGIKFLKKWIASKT